MSSRRRRAIIAVQLLKHGYPRRKGKPKGRSAIYRGEDVKAPEQIWEIYGRICSKRLQPYLPEGIKVLERCDELRLTYDWSAIDPDFSRGCFFWWHLGTDLDVALVGGKAPDANTSQSPITIKRNWAWIITGLVP